MNRKKHNLIVVAHPDDESIYFSGLIQQSPGINWEIICVTDGNADGNQANRLQDFHNACRELGVENYSQWDFPDLFEKRINIQDLTLRLSKIDTPEKIYTHGIIGEYGHPHHQDVSFAVHQAFFDKSKILSVSYNCYPDEIYTLTQKEFDTKMELLLKNYASELNRFANLVPGSFCEGFTEVSMDEVETIYQSLTGKSALDVDKLQKYKWIAEHIKQTLSTERPRLF